MLGLYGYTVLMKDHFSCTESMRNVFVVKLNPKDDP